MKKTTTKKPNKWLIATYPGEKTYSFPESALKTAQNCYDSLKDDSTQQAIIWKDLSTGKILHHFVRGNKPKEISGIQNVTLSTPTLRDRITKIGNQVRMKAAALKLIPGQGNPPGCNNRF